MTRILLIESDPGERLILASRLVERGHEVASAESGAEGVAAVRTGQHDLVLLSAELPSGETLDACRGIRSVPSLHLVPVVIYTSTSPPPEVFDRVYDAGCDAFVTKAHMRSIDRVVEVQLRAKAVLEGLSEQNRALEIENRRLDEERQRDADLQASTHGAGQSTLVARELAAGRPDGVMIVDGAGVVHHADRGAREMLAGQVAGRTLGSLVPASGLEAFVRDAGSAPREGFRFDVSARKDRATRSLMASVMPVSGDEAGGAALRVVLLLDLGKRRIAEEMVRGQEPGIPRQQIGVLLDAARSVYVPDAVVGRSDAAAQLRERVAEAASARRRPLLLQGERGAGKELAARIVHYAGGCTGPILRLDCGSMTPEHLERELFGYLRGSSPESVASHPGLFLLATDGTLLLSEVGELAPGSQKRLLETLERGSIKRGGSGRRERIDARLIVSSTQDLRELARAGRFLPELLEQIGHRAIAVPPLRGRGGDVEDLATHFVRRYGRGGAVEAVGPQALWAMQRYSWPGNVAELQGCIEQACDVAEGGIIEVEHLTEPLRGLFEGLPAPDIIPAARPAPQAVRVRDPLGGPAPLERLSAWTITEDDPISLEFYEKQALTRALHNCNGDKLAAAKLLNVGKSTLYRKLKRYGIG